MIADLAREILEVAKQGGYYDKDLPEDPAALIEDGNYFFAEAKKAQDAGMTDDAIRKIVELGGSTNGGASAQPAEAPPEPEALPDDQLGSGGDGTPEEAPPPQGSTGGEESRAVPEPVAPAGEAEEPPSPPRSAPLGEKLPVPGEIEGDPTPMPRDLTGVSDREIRRLHGENNAFLARATWVVSVTASDLRNSERMRDHAYRQSLKKVDRMDPDTEKPKLKEVLDSEAKESEEYRLWDERVRQHEDDLDKLKALKEIYKGNVSALSREASMRSDEFQRSGGKG